VTGAVAALAVYSLQILIMIAAAALGAAAVPLSLPAARLRFWQVVTAGCLALPLLPFAAPGAASATVTFGAADVAIRAAGPVASSSAVTWTTALWIVAGGILLRASWLALGAWRLRGIRRRAVPCALSVDLEAMRAAMAVRARCFTTADLAQPATFGVLRPVILLPRTFTSLEPDAQRAVLCHELLHAARRDWLAVLGEEALKCVFWFHPAMWWLMDRLHLTREQLVDQLVVARTASRRVYMDALLRCADAEAFALPATAFIRRRHLVARLHELSKEPHMTRRRLVISAGALLLALAGATTAVVRAFPLEINGVLAQTADTRLDIRLAELAPAAGLTEAAVLGSGQPVYLRAETIATRADVSAAQVVDDGAGHIAIAVAFDQSGSARMTAATRGHLGKPVAILLDGRVIAAPVLRGPIGASATITGSFTKAQAEAIVRGLRPAAAAAPAAAPRPQAYTTQDPGVVLPVALSKARPMYTQAAMDAKIQGVVELTAVVTAAGTIGNMSIVQSLDPTYGLDDAALEAVSQWTFTPGTKDGTPVDVEVHISIRFTLT
jgi:TonB family protein